MTKERLLLAVIIAGVALAASSFIGGSVGALITGRAPVGIFAVSMPHIMLAVGKPFPGLPITHAMIASWITVLLLFAVFFTATRRMKLIPGGLQNFVELLCETASAFIKDVAGEENERRFFPVVFTIFLFIVVNAWISLVPGFESIKVNGVSLLRNANADINVPLMLALVSLVAVEYWGFKAKGVSYLKNFVNFDLLAQDSKQSGKGKSKAGVGSIFGGIVAIFVGMLEVLSHLVRVVSFTFRLFGNMTAGLILTGMMIFIVPMVIPAVFYGLEALFGFIQALIFSGLTLVFGYSAVMATE